MALPIRGSKLMKLERVGQTLATGFGDRVLIGVIIGFLSNVTPFRACEYIQDDIELGYWLSDDNWRRYKQMAKGIKVDDITVNDIIEGLRKHRSDVLGVILNHPNGLSWLNKQVDLLKEKLK